MPVILAQWRGKIGAFYNNTLAFSKISIYYLILSLPYRFIFCRLDLKVQSCKLYNNKYMVASTERTNTEIFAFTAVLVFKLLSRKVLFTNRKGNRNC